MEDEVASEVDVVTACTAERLVTAELTALAGLAALSIIMARGIPAPQQAPGVCIVAGELVVAGCAEDPGLVLTASLACAHGGVASRVMTAARARKLGLIFIRIISTLTEAAGFHWEFSRELLAGQTAGGDQLSPWGWANVLFPLGMKRLTQILRHPQQFGACLG